MKTEIISLLLKKWQNIRQFVPKVQLTFDVWNRQVIFSRWRIFQIRDLRK